MDEPDGKKLKAFLGKKCIESQTKIKKLKHKRNITKCIYYITAISSIVISSVLASKSMLTIPPLVFTMLSVSSAILTGISIKFNFQDKTIMLNREIKKLDKIQSELDSTTSSLF